MIEEYLKQMSSFFNVPEPKVVLSDIPFPGAYVRGTGTIYIRRGLPEELMVRVLTHEFAHYVLDYFGVGVPEEEEEAYARVFEEFWLRANPEVVPYTCPNDGFKVLFYGGRGRCYVCGAEYSAEGVMVCEVCGELLPAGPEVVVCPVCGATYFRRI